MRFKKRPCGCDQILSGPAHPHPLSQKLEQLGQQASGRLNQVLFGHS